MFRRNKCARGSLSEDFYEEKRMSILSHHDEFDNYYPLTKNNQGSNQGDLISRSELRKKYQAILDRGDMFCEYDIIGMVNNAPTVEPQKIVTIPPELIEKLAKCVVDTIGNINWDKAIEAYKARPQGEWGKWIISEIRCPNCTEVFNPEGYSTETFKRCPNCDADMRGGRE
jgi:hypothetical protein